MTGCCSACVSFFGSIFKSNNERNLTEDEIESLEKITKLNRNQILKWYQHFLQACPDGHLRRQHFKLFYQYFDSEAASVEEYCDYIFDGIFAYDIDDSDYIDFQEFLVAFSIVIRGCLDLKLNFLFDILDRNKNQFIDKNELKKFLKVLFLVSKIDENLDEYCEILFNKLDKSSNFNSGKGISRKDFVNTLKNDEEYRKVLLREKIIENFDEKPENNSIQKYNDLNTQIQDNAEKKSFESIRENQNNETENSESNNNEEANQDQDAEMTNDETNENEENAILKDEKHEENAIINDEKPETEIEGSSKESGDSDESKNNKTSES